MADRANIHYDQLSSGARRCRWCRDGRAASPPPDLLEPLAAPHRASCKVDSARSVHASPKARFDAARPPSAMRGGAEALYPPRSHTPPRSRGGYAARDRSARCRGLAARVAYDDAARRRLAVDW
jgi:hypothetical protein